MKRRVRVPTRLGATLAGIWFVLYGLVSLINLHFAGLDLVLAILAIAAGVLLVLGR